MLLRKGLNISDKILCIGGGVGPAASVLFHQTIIDNTKAINDQEHLPVIHISCSSLVTDRTEFLLNNKNMSWNEQELRDQNHPGYGMYIACRNIFSFANTFNCDVVIGVPCNTFHSPKIFNVFQNHMEKEAKSNNSKVYVVNMLDETAQTIKRLYPHIKKVGLLSTTGTRQSNVYSDLLQSDPYNYELIQVDNQSSVHEAIYNPVYGIKANSIQPTQQSIEEFHNFANQLIDKGAEIIILGCTEIPLVFNGEYTYNQIPLFNPMTALARKMIEVGTTSGAEKLTSSL